MNVLIADNYELFREGLKQMLLKQSNGEINEIREVSHANELMDALANKTDILFLNFNISGRDGLEILKNIRLLHPEVPILVFSAHSESKIAVRVLKAGASGYFSKSGTSEDLAEAIRTIVLQKKKYVSPSIAGQLAVYFDSSENKLPHEHLSDREYQVLCKIASGKKINSIAADLSLSVQTIHTYRARLKEKMGMKTDTEFTKYAIQHDLID